MTSMKLIVIRMKKICVAAGATSRNSTRNAMKSTIDNRWSISARVPVRVALRISTKSRSRATTIRRSPKLMAHVAPESMDSDITPAPRPAVPPKRPSMARL
ncbi:hypothetical protein D3C87_1768540 [compost metagenome]